MFNIRVCDWYKNRVCYKGKLRKCNFCLIIIQLKTRNGKYSLATSGKSNNKNVKFITQATIIVFLKRLSTDDFRKQYDT